MENIKDTPLKMQDIMAKPYKRHMAKKIIETEDITAEPYKRHMAKKRQYPILTPRGRIGAGLLLTAATAATATVAVRENAYIGSAVQTITRTATNGAKEIICGVDIMLDKARGKKL